MFVASPDRSPDRRWSFDEWCSNIGYQIAMFNLMIICKKMFFNDQKKRGFLAIISTIIKIHLKRTWMGTQKRSVMVVFQLDFVRDFDVLWHLASRHGPISCHSYASRVK